MKLQQLLLLHLPLLLLLSTTATTFTTTPTTTATTESCEAFSNKNNQATTSIISRGIAQLGIGLVRELKGLGTVENIIISPYSVWSVLGMVLAGAETNTKQELLNALGLRTKEGSLSLWRTLEQRLTHAVSNDLRVSLDLANKVYLDDNFTLATCQQHLAHLIHVLDLSKAEVSAKTINSFVNKTTKGLIPTIVTPDHLTADTTMVLVNAVYFKGEWTRPFLVQDTKLRPFYVEPEHSVDVQMMFAQELPCYVGFSEALNSRILQLPYSTGVMKMTIILPNTRGQVGINEMLAALDATTLTNTINSVQESNEDVYLPKFQIKSDFGEDLKKALNALGIQDAFTHAADLRSFSSNLYVQHIMHKAVVKVDEKGSEAAAVTGAVISIKIKREFRANRPFFFLIHQGETVLFMGLFTKP